MHICILSRSTIFHESYGGMEHVAHELARELQMLGNEVTVLTTSFNAANNKNIPVDLNYSLISIEGTRSMSYSREWWSKSREYFDSLNAEKKVDLVLSISAAANSLVKEKSKYGIPFVFQAHGTSLGEIKSKLQLGWKKRLSSVKNIVGYIKDLYYIPAYDLVIPIGNKVYHDYIKSPIKLNNNVKLINNAIDTRLFTQNNENKITVRMKLGIPHSAHVFISTSRLHQQKGIKQSILMFHEIKKNFPNSYYLIIGEGPEKENIRKEVEDLGLKNNVRFIGEIKREELSQYYSSADYMLFATLRQEGLPLILLEALSNSVVCFVSSNIEFDSLFPFQAINPNNILSSSKTITDFLEKNIIDSVIEDGINAIMVKYSMDDWGRKYDETFKNLIKKTIEKRVV